MRLFLHIGLPKTGSTYLQEWLKLNSLALAKIGMNVVPSLSAHRLAVATLGEEFSRRSDIVEICSQVSLEQALADTAHDCTIISSEYFSHASPKAVQDLFQKTGHNLLKTIVYLRRQDILCAAGYAQEIKALGATHTIEKVLYTDALDWVLLQQSWKNISDGVVLLNYDLHRHDLSDSFLRAIGIENVLTGDLPKRFNVSLSAEMTEVARLLNLKGQRFDIQNLESVKGRYPDIPFGFSSEVTRKFEAFYIDSNRKLAEIYPDEFNDYATEKWESPGQDFTGRISKKYLAEIMCQIEEKPLNGWRRVQAALRASFGIL